MVPYYKERTPGLPQWAGGMQAAVVLDQPGNVAFTNLDHISGKVVVRCGKSADIDSIVVKLEGESRTRLLSPAGPRGEAPKPQLEYHKILYRVQGVFPPPDVAEQRDRSSGKSNFTLPPGTHQYPFSFKIPFNNSCWSDASQTATVKISPNGVEVSRPPPSHTKQTLPPTLSGFPGEAEIRYFVKATIARHAFWKENPRVYTPFNFLPIEPPRPPVSGSEVFARQRHDFPSTKSNEGAKSKVKGFFGGKDRPASGTWASESPSISVDVRLPEPAVLTCNSDIPLRLIVKKLGSGSAMLTLHSLQISLIGSTKIRAHEVFRTETSSWVLVSQNNLGMPLGAASDAAGTEIEVDNRLWRSRPLPNTVAPSFETCNIERTYQLDVRVGLTLSGPTHSTSKQHIILPLRLDTRVYSGIAPPQELLDAMAGDGNVPLTSHQASSDATEHKLPVQAMTSGANDLKVSARHSGHNGGETADAAHHFSDAPPSYEDAVASELPPVSAPRPDYAPPPSADDDVLRGDDKRGLMGQRSP